MVAIFCIRGGKPRDNLKIPIGTVLSLPCLGRQWIVVFYGPWRGMVIGWAPQGPRPQRPPPRGYCRGQVPRCHSSQRQIHEGP